MDWVKLKQSISDTDSLNQQMHECQSKECMEIRDMIFELN